MQRNLWPMSPASMRLLADRTLRRLLARRGYTGTELVLARKDTVAWGQSRIRAVKARGGVVEGRAVVVTAPGRVQLRAVQHPLGAPGKVVVELLATAISPGTERAQWLRLPNARPAFPYTPGYSGVGRVVSCGPGPVQFAPGTLVAVPQAPHASVASVPAIRPVAVPDGVAPEDAALVYLAVISGYGVGQAELVPGEPLCVLGVGAIGDLALRLAMLEGPGAVTVVARSRRREPVVRALGISDFRLAGDDLGDVGAATVVESTGDPAAIAAAVAAARPGGTVVLLGSPRGPSRSVPLDEVQRKHLRVVGAHISSRARQAKQLGEDPFRRFMDTFLGALADGRLAVNHLAGEAVDPREIELVYHRLASGALDAAHLDWTRLPADERLVRRPLLSGPALPPVVPEEMSPPVVPAPARVATRPLRFAVVGCGDIGLSNAKAIGAAPNTELVLAYDAEPSLAAAATARAGGEVAPTLEAALDAGRVDAVVLSVPHDAHAPLAEQAAAAGLHVVVEKPLAVDLASARRAVDTVHAAGRVLSVCFPYRYEPALVTARQLVVAGALGAIRGASVVFHADKPDAYWLGGFSGRAASDWRTRLERAGGGVLIMNLTHYLDFVRTVAGVEAATVAAVGGLDPGAEVEDRIALSVALAGGGVLSVVGSASTRGAPANRFEIWGEDGTLCLEPEGLVYTRRAVGGLTPHRWSRLPADEGAPRASYFEAFADAVLEGRAPDVTAADGLAVQAVVEAAYESMRRGGAAVAVEPGP